MLERARRLASVFSRHAAEMNARGEVSREAIDELRRGGYAAFTLPRAFGGEGGSLTEFALTQEILGGGDASLALIAGMHGHLLGSAVHTWPPAVLARIARRCVDEGWLGDAVASEPELGSPSRGGAPKTTATPAPGGWSLSGRKTWATGVEVIDFLVVSALVPGGEVWRFVVPTSSPGLNVDRTWRDALSLRGSGSHDVVLENVFVPHEDVIPAAPSSPASSAWFWTAVAATYLGVGGGAVDELVRYANERVPTALGRPIATLPKIQEAVGRADLELRAARTLLHDVTRRWDDGEQAEQDLIPLFAAAKSVCTNAAVTATDLALRAAGGAGLTASLSLERFFRDARAGLTHPPADDLALQLLGKLRLGS